MELVVSGYIVKYPFPLLFCLSIENTFDMLALFMLTKNTYKTNLLNLLL